MKGLTRPLLAEFLGTAFLSATVIGSGIMASRLSPGDVGLQLLENSIATGAVLVALILTFGGISAAFNPVVTILGAILERASAGRVLALVAAQVAGACAGAVLANLMFDLSAVSVSQHDRVTSSTFLAEVVATVGLLLVIFGGLRGGRATELPYAVGGYIAAAYWFTSSTSFANPAIAVGRTLSDTFAGIAPASVPGFVGAQLLGLALALALVAVLWPEPEPAAEPAAEPVMEP